MTGAQKEAADVSTTEHVRHYALTTIAAGVVIGILYWGRVVFITSIVAIIIALILEPFVGLLVRLRFPRSIATFVVSLLAILVLYFAGLAAFNQISSLEGDFPTFKDRLTTVIDNIRRRIQSFEDSTAHILILARPPDETTRSTPAASAKARRRQQQSAPPAQQPDKAIQEVRIHEDHNPIVDYVYPRLGTLYQFILMSSFVPFLVYFMLSWRDHIYRSFLRLFEGADRVIAARSLEGIAEMARAFVVGNFLIGVLIAAASCTCFALLRLPYPFLVGTISGFLSLVPYIGLPLAFLPPVLGVLAGGQPSSILLLVFIIVVGLHLTTMNVLYPKLVGARVHLNPLIVTFSLMFWGFLWDAAGLVLAIPITAGLKAVCDNVTALRPYGRFLGD